MAVKWFRALTISGLPAGLAFACDVCRLEIWHSAPETVRHCNREDHAPARVDQLDVRQLGNGRGMLPNNVHLMFDATPDMTPEPEPKWWL